MTSKLIFHSDLNKNFKWKANGIIKSEEVKRAMLEVDRKYFTIHSPYNDSPQSIGHGATISAPVSQINCFSKLIVY